MWQFIEAGDEEEAFDEDRKAAPDQEIQGLPPRHYPEWDEATFEAALAEDAAIGTIVTKVHATDRDLRENRRVSYSLLDSAEGQFEVDSKRGLVSLARALDREERDSYNLTVRAMDAGRPRGTALTNLLVRVLGKFTKYRYRSYPVL